MIFHDLNITDHCVEIILLRLGMLSLCILEQCHVFLSYLENIFFRLKRIQLLCIFNILENLFFVCRLIATESKISFLILHGISVQFVDLFELNLSFDARICLPFDQSEDEQHSEVDATNG